MTARSREVARHAIGAALGALADARFGLAAPERRRQALARRTRSAFEQLGPAWVKLGQIISVRPDLFSAEWVFEMESLRDSVPPVPVSAVILKDCISRGIGATRMSWEKVSIIPVATHCGGRSRR